LQLIEENSDSNPYW